MKIFLNFLISKYLDYRTPEWPLKYSFWGIKYTKNTLNTESDSNYSTLADIIHKIILMNLLKVLTSVLITILTPVYPLGIVDAILEHQRT